MKDRIWRQSICGLNCAIFNSKWGQSGDEDKQHGSVRETRYDDVIGCCDIRSIRPKLKTFVDYCRLSQNVGVWTKDRAMN